MKSTVFFALALSLSANLNAQVPSEKPTPAVSSPKDSNVKQNPKKNPKKTPPTPIEPSKHEEIILEKTKDKTSDATETIKQETEKAVDDVKESAEQTRYLRGANKYFGYVTYSPLDLLIPSKIGATIGYNENKDTSWELEYLKGSVSASFYIADLGKMSDERISLIRRSYMGTNSFNISYGLSYYDFSIRLGDDYLNRMSYGNYPNVNMVEVQSLGLNVGIGNRWTFAKNLTLGVDWISWSQPLILLSRKSDFLTYATNESDRSDVDKALRWINNFPRLTLLKLQLGATF